MIVLFLYDFRVGLMDYVRVASKSSPIYSIHFLNSDKLDVFVDAVTTDLKLTENKNESNGCSKGNDKPCKLYERRVFVIRIN